MPYKDPAKRRERDHARYVANREKVLGQQSVYNAAHLKERAAYRLRLTHGMRPEGWAALWEEQDGRCYLCGKELDGKIVVDHDHDCCPPRTSCSLCRRGLVHESCNLGIGWAGDDPTTLRRWADALEAAQNAYQARKAATVTIVQPLLFD